MLNGLRQPKYWQYSCCRHVFIIVWFCPCIKSYKIEEQNNCVYDYEFCR